MLRLVIEVSNNILLLHINTEKLQYAIQFMVAL